MKYTSCVKHFQTRSGDIRKGNRRFYEIKKYSGAQDAILETLCGAGATDKRTLGVFAKKQPLHIEVGMGKGRFLMDLARLHPDINYRIEMYDGVLLRALQKRKTERMERFILIYFYESGCQTSAGNL